MKIELYTYQSKNGEHVPIKREKHLFHSKWKVIVDGKDQDIAAVIKKHEPGFITSYYKPKDFEHADVIYSSDSSKVKRFQKTTSLEERKILINAMESISLDRRIDK